MKELKLSLTIKVIEQLHHTLLLQTPKDLLVMQQRTKLLRTQSTLSSMLKDLSEESSMIQLSKRILNFGHSKLNLDLMTNQSLSLNIKEKQRNSTQKKYHLWS